MGTLSDLIFGKDYSEVLETGIQNNGEALFVGVHADGRGATVLTQDQLPEVSDVGDWASFATAAEQELQNSMQGFAGDIMRFTTEMGGQSAAVSELINSGIVDIFGEPDFSDVATFDEALELISKEAATLSNSSNDPEMSAVMGDVANDAWSLQEQINEVLESTGFSAVNAANREMSEMGVPQAGIAAAMVMPESVNPVQANPVPGMEQFP